MEDAAGLLKKNNTINLIKFSRLPIKMFILGFVCMCLWGVGFVNQHERAMFSYLYSYMSIIGLSLGSMIFVLLQHITRAGWSVVIRRIPEAAMATMPLFMLLFIPIAMNIDLLFPWTAINSDDIILIKKAPYLSVGFFYIRCAIYLFLWTVIGLWFYRQSIKQDDENNPEISRKMWAISAPSIIVFALTTSFASFDWLMSMQPHWFSTIFGVYFFSGNLLSSLAFITLFLVWMQKNNFLNKKIVNVEHYHDLGKLIFGFVIFWAYISFSQFMLYWYGNIPEETEFYLHRLHSGWEWMSYILPISNFIIPFFLLLSRHAKRKIKVLVFGCIWIIFSHLFDIFWLVMPNFNTSNGKVSHFTFSWMDIVCPLAMMALFIAYICYLLNRVHIVSNSDPRLKESINFENF